MYGNSLETTPLGGRKEHTNLKFNEARDVVGMLKAATSTHSLDAATMEYWELQMQALDADVATKTVLTGAKVWRFFPSWAGFQEIYNAECRKAEPAGARTTSDFLPVGTAEPAWVTCWRAARQENDERQFPEQIPALAEAMLDNPLNRSVSTEELTDASVWVQPGEYGYEGCRYDFTALPEANKMCVWHPQLHTAQPLRRVLIGDDLGGTSVMMCIDCRERYLKRREEALRTLVEA